MINKIEALGVVFYLYFSSTQEDKKKREKDEDFYEIYLSFIDVLHETRI